MLSFPHLFHAGATPLMTKGQFLSLMSAMLYTLLRWVNVLQAFGATGSQAKLKLSRACAALAVVQLENDEAAHGQVCYSSCSLLSMATSRLHGRRLGAAAGAGLELCGRRQPRAAACAGPLTAA